MNKDVFGQAGDFITSPEISQVFGEVQQGLPLVAVFVENDWNVSFLKKLWLWVCGEMVCNEVDNRSCSSQLHSGVKWMQLKKLWFTTQSFTTLSSVFIKQACKLISTGHWTFVWQIWGFDSQTLTLTRHVTGLFSYDMKHKTYFH